MAAPWTQAARLPRTRRGYSRKYIVLYVMKAEDLSKQWKSGGTLPDICSLRSRQEAPGTRGHTKLVFRSEIHASPNRQSVIQ